MAETKAVAAQLRADAITQIANVGTLLRKAIQASIPVAPEQYMTIAIPGTVIDIRDIDDGGTFIYGAEHSAFPPLAVRQAEARLVDNMIPLSNIMVGNTGKSVARSYSRALDGLVPKKATVKSGGVNPIRSPGEPGYDAAMRYLTTVDPETGATPVDVYVEKQQAWAQAQDAWDKAKIQAQQEARAKYPGDVVLQREEYDQWNQANYRKFKFAAQGRWMDWVTNGHKYEVEFNFGMVDTESIMARVESSKESFRNSTLVDVDGANEVLGVNLTPKNWATLCKQKQDGWFQRNGKYTVEQLDAEIRRLENLRLSYNALKTMVDADPPTYPVASPVPEPTVKPDGSTTTVSTAFTTLYTAEAAMNKYLSILQGKKTDDEKKAITDTAEYKKALTDLAAERAKLADAIEADTANHTAWTKFNIATVRGEARGSVTKWLTDSLATITEQIALLKDKRLHKLTTQPMTVSAIAGSDLDGADGTTGTIVAAPGSELANSVFGVGPSTAGGDTSIPAATGGTSSTAANVDNDPWTTISASFSASDQKSTAYSKEWGMSVGGAAGWGLWSVGGSYAHSQLASGSTADMASCDVSITFDALVVNIGRPWLYAEIFSDFELDVADNILLSPGAQDLHVLMAQQSLESTDPKEVARANTSVVAELAQYNSFPAFPTSFVVAANTVIEFHGDTQHIEQRFSAQANSGSVSVGWGPWSVSSSFHQASSSRSHQVQTTATGCRISFGAPQIIGWVSQILPALPRKTHFEPMVQNVVGA